MPGGGGGAEEAAHSLEFVDLVRQELMPVMAQLDRLETVQMSLATKVENVMADSLRRQSKMTEANGCTAAYRKSPRRSPATTTDGAEKSEQRRPISGLQWDVPEIDAVLAERDSIVAVNATDRVESASQDGEDDSPQGKFRNHGSASNLSDDGVSMKASKVKEAQKLLEIFLTAEEEEELNGSTEEVQLHGLLERFKRHHKKIFEKKESIIQWLDSWMGLIISANAIFIGIAIDHEPANGAAHNEPGWLVANVIFCAIFCIELALKLSVHGFREHFCGDDKAMNWFDACLVFVDTLQLGISFMLPSTSKQINDTGLPSPSMFRVVRLLRLLRLVRLSRSEAAKDLVNMLTGLAGGARTLLWATALFVIVMYIIALILQEALAASEAEGGVNPNGVDISDFFSSTPRSMFTVFRCSFGDCSDRSGTPIVEHMNETFGVLTSMLFILLLFFVVIGLFNVISAIFVESTLSAAEKMQKDTKERRLSNETLFATEVSRLMKGLLEKMPHEGHADPSSANGCSHDENDEDKETHDEEHISNALLSERMDEVMALELPCSVINRLVNDPNDESFRLALTKLDIDPGDHRNLATILDPDGSGNIDAVEFVTGVERLRGEPRRSDVVSVQLMIRSLQKQVEEDKSELTRMVESIRDEVHQAITDSHDHHAALHAARHYEGPRHHHSHHHEGNENKRQVAFQHHRSCTRSFSLLM